MSAPVRLPDALTFAIEWDDIGKGERSNPKECAAAVALRRAGYRTPHVLGDRVRVIVETETGPEVGVYAVSTALAQFLRRFDAGVPVDPLTITLAPRGNRSIFDRPDCPIVWHVIDEHSTVGSLVGAAT